MDGFSMPRPGKDLGDHPPITPVNPGSEELIGKDAWRLYQYVCEHFLGSISSDCQYVR